MPDDVGGKPFPDGDEPDDHHHGAAELGPTSPSAGEGDAFASVVFDEDFVRSAEVHEPSAVERMLAAAQARAEAEATRGGRRGARDDDPYDEGYGPDGEFGHDPDDPRHDGRYGYGHAGDDPDADEEFGPYGEYGDAGRPYRGHAHWQRPVAWVLAVLMGIGVVAMAFTAVYRGASGGGNRQDPSPPPASSEVDGAPGAPGDEPEAAYSETVRRGADTRLLDLDPPDVRDARDAPDLPNPPIASPGPTASADAVESAHTTPPPAAVAPRLP
ncbi:SCO2584 family spore wall biosynthesis protein [Streptomyces buecherae]|uniref:SCO2584 family spore wall biosynthesis protein n=1 Tax=Streptomyces buecherae TaxID=2763006 RepID=UPI00365B6A31